MNSSLHRAFSLQVATRKGVHHDYLLRRGSRRRGANIPDDGRPSVHRSTLVCSRQRDNQFVW